MEQFEHILAKNLAMELSRYKRYKIVRTLIDNKTDFYSMLKHIDKSKTKANETLIKISYTVYGRSCKEWIVNQLFDNGRTKEIADQVMNAPISYKLAYEPDWYDTSEMYYEGEIGFSIYLALEIEETHIVAYANRNMRFDYDDPASQISTMLTTMLDRALEIK